MAKLSSINTNERRRKLADRYANKRAALKARLMDRTPGKEKDRFQAALALAVLPRNSAKIRVRNRCFMTGRARGYHRDLGLSRIMLRAQASLGMLPGITKSSW